MSENPSQADVPTKVEETPVEENSCLLRIGKVWAGVKWLVECPSQETGPRKGIGYVLHVVLFAVAVLLLVVMLRDSTQAYVDYRSEGGDSSVAISHRMPDFVACPREVKHPATRHNVALNPVLFKASGMSTPEFDQLAAMQKRDCAAGSACDWEALDQKCDETIFEQYCIELEKIFAQDPLFLRFSNETYWSRIAESNGFKQAFARSLANQIAALSLLREQQSGRWTLKMLWIATIHPGYDPIGEIIAGPTGQVQDRSGLQCYYYSTILHSGRLTGVMREDEETMSRQQETTQTVWVGNSLCFAQSGNHLPERSTVFFGCKTFLGHPDTLPEGHDNEPPFRYWLGNLEGNELREDAFYLSIQSKLYNDTVKRRVNSGVVHYSMIEVLDETKSTKNCLMQPHVKGMVIPCPQTKNGVVSWHYDLKTQTRQLTTVWIYGKSKVKLSRYPAFTTYTQLQFGAGIFGTLLGMSVAQLLEAASLLFNTLATTPSHAGPHNNKNRGKLFTCLRVVTILALIATTAYLTIFDMSKYVEARYSPIFIEKPSELSIPSVKLCGSRGIPFGFINNTKLNELNVSLQLNGYLKFAGLFQKPKIKLIAKTRTFPNGTFIKEVPEWMIRNFGGNITATSVCHQDYVLCENIPTLHYLGRYLPDDGDQLRPWRFEASERNTFFKRMRQEAIELAGKLGLPKDAPVNEILSRVHLDPVRLIKECIVRGSKVHDCGTYADYTYGGEQNELCFTLRIPESKVPAPKDYGYQKGIFVTFDNEEYHKHSDIFSYYGPGVDEERKKNRLDTQCYAVEAVISERSAAEGFKNEHCTMGSGWSLKIQLQSFSTQEIEYRIPPRLPPTSFAAEIRASFSQTEVDAKCTDRQAAPVCQDANSDMAGVFISMHFETQCSCSFCYGSKQNQTANKLRIVSQIMGWETRCCRDDKIMSCYSDMVKKVDWLQIRERYQQFLREDSKFVSQSRESRHNRYMKQYLSSNQNYQNFAKFRYSPPAMSEKKFKDATVEELRKMFDPSIAAKLTEKQLSEFAEFAKKCYEKPCNVESLELMSLQERDSVGNQSVFAIFYSTPDAYGMKIIDILDPVQLFATLFAGYSATFGISVMGMMEVVIGIISNWRQGKTNKTAADQSRRHILKTITIFLAAQVKPLSAVNPAEIHPGTELNEVVNGAESKGDNKDLSLKSGSSVKGKKAANVLIEVEGTDGELQGDVECGESQEQGKSDEIEVADDPLAIVSCPVKPFTESGKRKSNDKTYGVSADSDVTEIESDDEVTSNKVGVVFVLLLLIAATSFFVVSFFLTFSNETFDGEVLEVSYHERPSPIVCVETREDSDRLLQGLKNASCSVRESFGACNLLFTTFMRTEDRFCVVQDNTRRQLKANENQDDLVMEVSKDFPPAVVGAMSFNGTSLDKIYPFTQWRDQNAVLSYSMLLRVSEKSDCQKEIPTKPCTPCPRQPDQIVPLSFCCFPPKLQEPAITAQRTCAEFSFLVQAISQKKEPGVTGRTLIVKATKRNMIVYAKRDKYNFVYYISIVGGFVGALLEITVLNIIGAATLGAAALVVRVLRRHETEEQG